MSSIARRASLLVPLALAGCGVSSCQPEAPAARPNLLIVTLDTTRVDVIGAYGHKGGASPTLDRLASEGVRFDRAYTVTPLTIPSHSSLFTGLYPPRHGVRDNGDFFLSDGAHTMAERLHEAGYATMASVGAQVTSHHWGFAQGFDAFFDDMGESDEQNRWRVERRGDEVVDDALAWLRERAPAPEAEGGQPAASSAGAEQPWFAWVHLFDVHHPYEPPPPFDAQFPGRPYLGELAFADSQVERLRAFLEESDQLDDTWIFVMADHGEGLGSHGEALHGVLIYNATTHIPLIVRPPGGLEVPHSHDFPVSLVDVLPTAMAALGLDAPADVDGDDVSAWLTDTPPAGPVEREVYVESLYAWHHYGWAPQKALVDLTHFLLSSTTPELYAAGDDEMKDDLVGRDPKRAEAMQSRLDVLIGGMEPDGETADRAALSGERLAQLEALGYVTTSAEDLGEPTDGLPDPVQRLPVLKEVEGVRKAMQSGEHAAAIEAARALIDKEPGLMEPRMMMAAALGAEGRVEEAIAVVQELLELRPTSSQANAMLGSLLMRSRDLDGAIEALAEAVSTDPYLPVAWLQYLNALFIRGDLVSFEAELTRARGNLPDDLPLIGLEGLLLAMRGEHQAAKPMLLTALEATPNQPFLNHGLGMALRAQGQHNAAEEAFLEEVELHKPALTSRTALAAIYAEQRRYEEQLAQLEVILLSVANDPQLAHAQAQALFNLKRYDEAAASVERCQALAPTYPACAMLEANVLKKQGKDAEAQAAYERALALASEVTGEEIKGVVTTPAAPTPEAATPEAPPPPAPGED